MGFFPLVFHLGILNVCVCSSRLSSLSYRLRDFFWKLCFAKPRERSLSFLQSSEGEGVRGGGAEGGGEEAPGCNRSRRIGGFQTPRHGALGRKEPPQARRSRGSEGTFGCLEGSRKARGLCAAEQRGEVKEVKATAAATRALQTWNAGAEGDRPSRTRLPRLSG